MRRLAPKQPGPQLCLIARAHAASARTAAYVFLAAAVKRNLRTPEQSCGARQRRAPEARRRQPTRRQHASRRDAAMRLSPASSPPRLAGGQAPDRVATIPSRVGVAEPRSYTKSSTEAPPERRSSRRSVNGAGTGALLKYCAGLPRNKLAADRVVPSEPVGVEHQRAAHGKIGRR